MIYAIVAYGDPVLRKVTVDIDKSVDVQKLSEDMFEIGRASCRERV